MTQLSNIFSKSKRTEKTCARCKAMLGSVKGLQALISQEGYEHYKLKDMFAHYKRGCPMCLKILTALKREGIREDFTNPGWINFYALDAERNRILGSGSNTKTEVPTEAKRMRYLEAEGPKKNDFFMFMICSAEGYHLDYPPTTYSMADDIMAKAVIAHLGECSRDHPQCARCSESLLPSRIIDLGPPGKTTEPRLKINNKSEIGHYACLSYCWGGAQEYMTTRANIDGYLKSLSLSSLSKTIQDAIKVTRMLHLRYLWIDALCIIQDSTEDKRREMAYMGMIYKNATVTIAAAGAKFVSQGFLDDWSAGDAQPAVLPLMHRTKGSVSSIKIVNTGFFNTNLWPLESRAWALQEYLLSPRLLIFGYGGPVWQCQTQKLQPIIPSNQIFNMDLQRLPDTIFPPPTRRPNTSSARQNPAWPASERQEQHLTWKSIVENYSARQISFAADRLQAIAGIASELSYVWNDRYHFGMWHANLYQQLVWFAARPQEVQKAVPGMPSWSWLRINAGVKHLDYLRSVQLPRDPPLSTKSRFYSRSSCYVVGRNLVVNDADFLPANEMAREEKRKIFDIVEDRTLYLREKSLAEYLIELEGTRSYSRVGPLAAIVDFDRDVESEVAGDISTFQRDFEYGACEPGVPKVGKPHWHNQVAYLTLGVLLGGHHDLVHIGLIMMPVKGSFTTYERIGLFVLPGYGKDGESVFTKYSVTRTITIK